jgi:hypothetical protein
MGSEERRKDGNEVGGVGVGKGLEWDVSKKPERNSSSKRPVMLQGVKASENFRNEWKTHGKFEW